MSKGDKIEVMAATADGTRTFTVMASKAGRFVTKRTVTRQKAQWLVIEEVTRTKRSTGNTVEVPMAAVLAVHQTTLDVPEPKAKPKVTRASVATGRAFEAMGHHEAAPESLGLTE